MSTLSERLASFIMPRLDADHWPESSYRDTAYRILDLGVGGFGIFIGSLENTAAMLQDLRARAGRPLLFAADYEHGLPMRLRDGGIAFPRAMALGRTLPGITEHVAGAIAAEMRALGIHWNWAPVCDINSDPRNPIINVRSFGEDAATVGQHAAAYVRGLQAGGVMACAKHAPGHGGTHVDSHVNLPTVDADRATLEQREFAPFLHCINEGVGSIMMAHLLMPALDGHLPASLSSNIVGGLVRGTWGFNGLVTTDALDMGSITSRWSAQEAAVLAFLAGNDCLLLPEDALAAYNGLMKAFSEGAFGEERIAASEERWAVVRERYLKPPAGMPVDQNAHALMALKAADGAVRLSGNTSLLPITNRSHIAAFAVVDEHEMDAATSWFHYLAQATEVNIDFGYIDGTIAEEDLADLEEGIADADMVVFAFFGSAVAHRGTLSDAAAVERAMKRLAGDRASIIIACGSPYGVDDLHADLKMFTYSDTTPSLAASVLRLIGRPAGT